MAKIYIQFQYSHSWFYAIFANYYILASIFLPKTSGARIFFVAISYLVTRIDLQFRPPGAFMSRLFLCLGCLPPLFHTSFSALFWVFFLLNLFLPMSCEVPGSCALGPSFSSFTAKGKMCRFHPLFSLS